jgi:hypothetical protein
MFDNLLGNGFGPKLGPSTGTLTKVWANATGRRPKVGGCTFDWETVTPLAAPLTLPDETVFPIGARVLRYGMFIARITAVGAKQGMYGLYDSTANDGRQLRTRGECFFIESTVLVEDRDSRYVAGFEGGNVYTARMCLDQVLPGYMTRAQAEALFPQLRFTSTAR